MPPAAVGQTCLIKETCRRTVVSPGWWRQGLRTLAVATRLLGEDEYAEWDQRYQAAAAQLEGRDEALADLAAEVGAEFDLVLNARARS